MEKIPESLESVRRYLTQIRKGLTNPEDLAITRKLSRAPNSYRTSARTAIAAKQLQRAGIDLHPGQQVKYVVTNTDAKNPKLRVTALQLTDGKNYDRDWYTESLISFAEEILNPFSYTKEKIRSIILKKGWQEKLKKDWARKALPQREIN